MYRQARTYELMPTKSNKDNNFPDATLLRVQDW